MSAQAELALVVEDQRDTCEWLAQVARQAFPGIQVLTAIDLRSARQILVDHSRFRLVLVDLGLPDGSGAELIRALASSHPDSPSIVSTVYSDDESLFGAIAAGAQGYLLKSQPAELLVRHLQRFDEGIPPLSPSVAQRMLRYFRELPRGPANDVPDVALTARETEVLTCIGRGLRVAETAQLLGIAESTVAGYIKTLYAKLNIGTRAEAALEAVRRGLA